MIVLTDSEIGEIFRQPWPRTVFADGADGVVLDLVCFRDVVRTVEKAAYLRGYNKARNDVAMEKYHGMPNAELSGPRPLAAEGSRSNDGLERTAHGKGKT